MSPLNVNHIWPSCKLLDGTEKQKNIRLLVTFADPHFGSSDHNDKLDVLNFLRFCKYCRELFSESRRN